jgi:hypothetical protein
MAGCGIDSSHSLDPVVGIRRTVHAVLEANPPTECLLHNAPTVVVLAELYGARSRRSRLARRRMAKDTRTNDLRALGTEPFILQGRADSAIRIHGPVDSVTADVTLCSRGYRPVGPMPATPGLRRGGDQIAGQSLKAVKLMLSAGELCVLPRIGEPGRAPATDDCSGAAGAGAGGHVSACCAGRVRCRYAGARTCLGRRDPAAARRTSLARLREGTAGAGAASDRPPRCGPGSGAQYRS